MSARWCGLDNFVRNTPEKRARKNSNYARPTQEFSYPAAAPTRKNANSGQNVIDQTLPQPAHYKNVNFNLEPEPMPDISSDSDNDGERQSKQHFVFCYSRKNKLDFHCLSVPFHYLFFVFQQKIMTM